MDFADDPSRVCLLVDNGSKSAASTRSLRAIAERLAKRLGRSVEPVSLLHSTAVPPHLLGDRAAEIFEPAVRDRHARGGREIDVIPLFFGPSGAIVDYLPERVARLATELPGLQARIAAPLAGNGPQPDIRIAEILVEHVREVIRDRQLDRPAVVVVDHGSPRRDVAAVRDQIARQVAEGLKDECRTVTAASMERRPGPDYAFSDPLLESALRHPTALPAGDVVAALLFFSPGRHAGPDGDIAQICRVAERGYSGARVYATRLFSEHPRLIEILADRYAQLAAIKSGD